MGTMLSLLSGSDALRDRRAGVFQKKNISPGLSFSFSVTHKFLFFSPHVSILDSDPHRLYIEERSLITTTSSTGEHGGGSKPLSGRGHGGESTR